MFAAIIGQLSHNRRGWKYYTVKHYNAVFKSMCSSIISYCVIVIGLERTRLENRHAYHMPVNSDGPQPININQGGKGKISLF